MVVYRRAGADLRDVYERIQVRLAQNAVPVRVNSTPLLQVAFCGRCGAPMHRTTTKKTYGGKPYEYSYYHCNHAHMRDGKCSAKRVKAGPLEKSVFDNVLELVGDVEMTETRLGARSRLLRRDGQGSRADPSPERRGRARTGPRP